MEGKMKNRKKYIVLTIVIIAALVLTAVYFMKGRNSVFKAAKSKAQLGTIKETIEETGTVFSKRINTFYSDTSKKVEVVYVSVGDRVKKGDIILTYENNYDLEIEKENRQIDAITATYNETVKGADFEQISNEKLTINSIERKLDMAKRNLEKVKSLYENNAISKVEYEESQNNVGLLENQLKEANNNYKLLIRDVSANIKRKYEAQIEEIMVQIRILEKQKEQSSIIAEFDGIVTELNVSEGGMTKPGIVVAEIQDDKNLGIYVDLLAEDASKVTVGMPFEIVNEKTSEELEDLKVNRIYPKAEAKVSDLGVEQKRVRVEADLKENFHNLKISSEVDAVILLKEKNNVLLIDKDAVYEKYYKEYVTLIDEKDKVEREIVTGLKDDKNAEVISGLKENDVVLINY